jgi:Na+-translocating ferredoxin:NAD+ oxidoreductase RNF subunit RnfB
MWQQLLLPVLSLGGIEFSVSVQVCHWLLKNLRLQTDSRIDAVREALPGANCGACGYPGCDGLAAAIVEGRAPISACHGRRKPGSSQSRLNYGSGGRGYAENGSAGSMPG